MNPTTWRPEDGHLLRSLRIQAGLDDHFFARHNTLSLAQLKELESGDGQHFYNDAIKRNAGVKLLKKLGYEFPEPSPQQPDTLSLPLATEIAQVARPADALPGPEQRPGPGSTPAAARHPGLWMGGLLVTGLVVFVLVQGQPPSPLERQQTQAIAGSHVQPAGPATPPGPLTTDAQSAGSNVTAESPPPSLRPDPLPLPQPLPVTPDKTGSQIASAACDDSHRRNSSSHTPSNPIRPGNYVYIEARTDNQLCVLDSQNKLSILSLKAGMNHTVNGLAPFLVHATDWQGLQVFFQGRPVRIEHGDSTHVVLNSLPL